MTALRSSTVFAVLLSALCTQGQNYNTSALDSLATPAAGNGFTRPGFLLTGYSSASFIADTASNSFGDLGFSPIFLWRPTERFFFEGELEMEYEDGALVLNLEYADMNLVLNKYVTLRVGKFLSPFGTFQNLYHPSWINKLPLTPLGFGHDGVGPGSEFGAAITGGVPLGSTKINYNLYVSNGPVLNLGAEEPGEEGMLMYDNYVDNNRNKAVGGRLGWLPLANSSLELGASLQTALVGDAGGDYESVRAIMSAYDLNYVKQIEPLKGTFDIKAQWNGVVVDQADYLDPEDSTGTGTYTYANQRSSYYVQFAYRPTMVRGPVLKNLEAVFRYSALDLPAEAKENEDITQPIIGLNYWAGWRTVIKAAYQPDAAAPRFWLQLALGF